jgi:hypothetical protein
MMDIFPFPSVKGKTPEEQIPEILNYLVQFKETLEFELAELSSRSTHTASGEGSQGTGEQYISMPMPSKVTFRVNFETGHLEY